jgi:tetratricopeptide (TPR) repeat protein
MSTPRARLDEGLRFQKSGRFDEALACYRDVEASGDAALLSESLRRRAAIHHARSEWDEALETARRAAAVAREAGLVDQLAGALNAEAAVFLAVGRYDEAQGLLSRVLDSTSDRRSRGVAFQNLGFIAASQADFPTAKQHFMEAHRCYASAGLVWEEAYVLHNFGAAALEHASPRVAASLLEDAVGAAQRAEDLDLLALARTSLAEALTALGQLDEAERLAREAAAHFTRTGNRWRLIQSQQALATIALARGQRDEAVRLLRGALATAREIGVSQEEGPIVQRLSELGESAES